MKLILSMAACANPPQTPVTILDIERSPEPFDMFLPMADGCPTCGGHNLRVGDYVCYGECWWCNKKRLGVQDGN